MADKNFPSDVQKVKDTLEKLSKCDITVTEKNGEYVIHIPPEKEKAEKSA